MGWYCPCRVDVNVHTYTLHHGSRPLLISVPHAGTEVPRELLRRFSLAAQALPDTDWHVDKLYGFAGEIGASMLVANYSRYVVDLNRSPDSQPLYERAPTSAVCPTHTFKGDAIYLEDEPDALEVQERVAEYWRPYHEALEQEMQRLQAEYGYALLWDAHSIASEVPGLFAGVLPEFNLGTRDGAACPRAIADTLLALVTRDGKYGAVLNGRFKGGYITLHYGRPAERRYAVQLELAQRVYMNEATPLQWDEAHADSAADMISRLLETYLKQALPPP